jgi:outer membrane protein, heavy metal efflux system
MLLAKHLRQVCAVWLASTVAIAQAQTLLPLPPVTTESVATATTDTNTIQLLKLADIEQLALENHPALRQATAQIQAAQGKWVQAGLPNNPSFGYSGQQLGSNATEQQGVMFNQEFIRHIKLDAAQQAACHEVYLARRQLEMQRWRVLTDIRLAFWQVLVAQEQQELGNKLLKTAQLVEETAQKLRNAQEGNRIDLLQAKIETQQAELQQRRNHNRYQSAWQQLAAQLGIPMPQQAVVGDLRQGLGQLDYQTLWSNLLNNSPELAMTWADVQRARWQLRRQQVEPLPNLNLQVIVQYDKDVNGWDGGLQSTIPLAIRNKNQGNISQAAGEVRAAEAVVDKTRRNLERRLAETWGRYQDASQESELYQQQILPLAKESMELVEKGYRAGELPYQNLLLAQRTWFQAQVNALEALAKMRMAESELDGFLLSGSLEK